MMTGAVTLLAASCVGLVGFLLVLFGVIAVLSATDEGELADVGMIALGAALLLIGFYAGRYGHRVMRGQLDGAASTDGANDGDTVRSPPCTPPGARHRDR